MRFAAPLAAPGTRAARLNPAAKLGAITLLSVAALVATDPLTPTVLLAGVLVALPALGLPVGALLRRCWPLWLSAGSVALVNALFSQHQGGAVLFSAGPVGLSAHGALEGVALGLRVLAIALPGVAVFASTDPTDLADSLMQQLRVPSRFAIGALAAYRLLPVLADEWELLMLARRARGIDAGRNPLARVRLFTSGVFALLVGAIRRAGRLATAMDARAFDAGLPRTVARPQRFRRTDALLLAGTAILAAAAPLLSVVTGNFRFVA